MQSNKNRKYVPDPWFEKIVLRNRLWLCREVWECAPCKCKKEEALVEWRELYTEIQEVWTGLGRTPSNFTDLNPDQPQEEVKKEE